MINITKVFQFIIQATNIFTLYPEKDIRVQMDELGEVIGEAISYGYWKALMDYSTENNKGRPAVSRDGQMISVEWAKGDHEKEMQLIMKTVKARTDGRDKTDA